MGKNYKSELILMNFNINWYAKIQNLTKVLVSHSLVSVTYDMYFKCSIETLKNQIPTIILKQIS